MDKLQLTGRNLGLVFNYRMCVMQLFCYKAKQPNLKLKTWQKQLVASILLAFAHPELAFVPGKPFQPSLIFAGKTRTL
jgi:hypothetical protein